MFALQPSFLGGQRGFGPFSDFGFLGCLADQAHQSGNSVLAVLLLVAEPPAIDDKTAFLGHALSGQAGKAVPNVFGKRRGMGHIEAKLHGRGNLIDILTTGAGGADELLMNFFLIDRYRVGNSNHAFSVRRADLSCKLRFSPDHEELSKGLLTLILHPQLRGTRQGSIKTHARDGVVFHIEPDDR